MKLLFMKVGRFSQHEAEGWSGVYLKRLRQWHEVESRVIKEAALPKFLATLRHGRTSKIILADERGKTFTTPKLAGFLSEARSAGHLQQITFVIGGSYGFSEDDRKLADQIWALSPLTFAGDVAWLVLVEQVYRAFTILEGHPYHHG